VSVLSMYICICMCVYIYIIAIGYIDGTRQSALFSFINYLTLDGQNNLYVSDHFDDYSGSPGLPLNTIRRISLGDEYNVTTLAGDWKSSFFFVLYLLYLTIVLLRRECWPVSASQHQCSVGVWVCMCVCLLPVVYAHVCGFSFFLTPPFMIVSSARLHACRHGSTSPVVHNPPDSCRGTRWSLSPVQLPDGPCGEQTGHRDVRRRHARQHGPAYVLPKRFVAMKTETQIFAR